MWGELFPILLVVAFICSEIVYFCFGVCPQMDSNCHFCTELTVTVDWCMKTGNCNIMKFYNYHLILHINVLKACAKNTKKSLNQVLYPLLLSPLWTKTQFCHYKLQVFGFYFYSPLRIEKIISSENSLFTVLLSYCFSLQNILIFDHFPIIIKIMVLITHSTLPKLSNYRRKCNNVASVELRIH